MVLDVFICFFVVFDFAITYSFNEPNSNSRMDLMIHNFIKILGWSWSLEVHTFIPTTPEVEVGEPL